MPAPELAVVDEATFGAWRATYAGALEPFEYRGRRWACTGVCYPALDRFGYAPAAFLEAGEVVPEEEWPEASFRRAAPGTRGERLRIGDARRGAPWIYTGARLRASTNCGRPTEHSPGGSIHEPLDDSAVFP